MQSAPSTQPNVKNAADYFLTLPWYAQLFVGGILIGLSASILAAHLRAAFPADRQGWQKSMHYLYPSGLGALFALATPFLFPGLEFSIRMMIGVIAPYAWGPIYDALKKKYLGEVSSALPSSQDLLKVEDPKATATEGKQV